jgi:hypothetical protein
MTHSLNILVQWMLGFYHLIRVSIVQKEDGMCGQVQIIHLHYMYLISTRIYEGKCK